MTNITILDGGMGRELKRMGAPFRQPEWSALALMEAPEKVEEAHRNFIKAGAEVITTNAYALVPYHIGQDVFDARARELIKLSAKLARQAAGETVKVAGCIPPLFGSYEPENFIAEKAPDIIKPLIEEQVDDIDFWLVETTSSITEMQLAYDYLKGTGKPIWISFTISDRQSPADPVTNRAGETVEQCASLLLGMKGVEAMLFNCSHPLEMEDSIKAAKNVIGEHMPIGVYANSFKVPRANKANNISAVDEGITPDIYLELAKTWKNAGATLIGGCCGIGPEHIQALGESFK